MNPHLILLLIEISLLKDGSLKVSYKFPHCHEMCQVTVLTAYAHFFFPQYILSSINAVTLFMLNVVLHHDCHRLRNGTLQ